MIIPVMFVLDSSGSMFGENIGAVNEAMAGLKDIFAEMNAVENVQIGVLAFSSECNWITDGFIDISEYEHKEIVAGGLTSLGAALAEVGQRMRRDLFAKPVGEISKPIVVFMSDGVPTDEWEIVLKAVDRRNHWFANAARLSIGVGDFVDKRVMERLTVPTEYADIVSDWSDAARYVEANDGQEIKRLLQSLFYYSIADGYSHIDESSAVKTARILNNVRSSDER